MKYIIVFCITMMTTKPAVYKKDAGKVQPVVTVVCDSVKVNNEMELTNTLNSFTPSVTVKSIRATKK